MYRSSLGNTAAEQWLQVWSQHEWAGWIWASPHAAATAMAGCPFSAWIGNQKIFGSFDEVNKPIHPALGPPPSYVGYEWYQIWTVPALWSGKVTPEWVGWLYTKPSRGSAGSTKAHVKTFACHRITLVRNSTGQTVS